ncbi:hypothetical protein CR513_17289, partial [Mucuna pruriens]
MREERRERHGRRRKESKEEDLDMSKCRTPPFIGSKSVEEYHKKMEMDPIRAQIRESEEATLRSASRRSFVGASGGKGKNKEKERDRGEKIHKKGNDILDGLREEITTHAPIPPRTSSIKCFKCLRKGNIASMCPNRRVMIVKEDGEVDNAISLGKATTSSEAKTLSDNSHYKGDFLVVRQLMNSHMGEEAEIQRETIFHSRCLILGNLCSMIIDGGSCVNVASERLVKKLALPTIVHPRPYRLQWLSDKREFLIEKQAKVTFTPR